MKSKYIAVIMLLLSTVLAWVLVVRNGEAERDRMAQIIAEIEKNVAVATYKNNLPLYEELISLEPKNTHWRIELAETYKQLEQYGNYQKVCQSLINHFPEDKVGYEMLLNHYLEGKDYSKLINGYKDMPDEIRAEESISALYRQAEWQYTLLGRTYERIFPLSGNYFMILKDGLYGYCDSNGNESIKPKFENARPFIEEHGAVFKDGNWFFIDSEGDRVIATNELVEDLYSLSEGYAVAKIAGKYGYVDREFRQYHFEYDDATNFFNGVAAVKENGKWALINANFQPVTGFVYDRVVVDSAGICSRKGVIFAEQEGKLTMLNREGVSVTGEKYEDACLLYSDYAAVKKGDKWGFIDGQGKLVIDYQYDNAKSFIGGIAPVEINGYWGYIDQTGALTLDTIFVGAEAAMANGVAIVITEKGYRFIEFLKYK